MSFGQGSNPLSTLHSYHSGCRYDMVQESGPPHNKEFVMQVVVMDKAYQGKGKSKKLAKYAAAAQALKEIYNINLYLGDQAKSELIIITPINAHAGIILCSHMWNQLN